MSLTEASAVALAIAYLVLAIREHRWCWPAGIASSLLYLAVFRDAGLYLQSALQLVYVGMGIYGWRAWRPGGADGTLPIRRWPLRRHVLAVAAVAVLTAGAGLLLARHTDAPAPYLDAFATFGAVLATALTARKLLENWLYWFVVDAVTLVVAYRQGLQLTAALFALYLVLVVAGAVRWFAVWRRQAPAVPS